MNITAYIQQERQRTVEATEPWLRHVCSKYEQLDASFIPFLRPLIPYVLTGGKWARPLLCRLAYAYVTGEKTGHYFISGALEIFHRFLLCHDDIIDQDKQRHGRDTLEKHFDREQETFKAPYPVEMYGKGMAMVGGDLLFSLAIQLIRDSGIENEIKDRLIEALHLCLVETLAGWRLETILKTRSLASVTSTEIEKAMNLVSAQYSLVWPLRFGQVIGGCPIGSWNRALEQYGANTGMAFQIQDDILGIFGESHVTGKPVGNDLREDKKSLVLLEGYRRGTKQQREKLEKVMGTKVTGKELKEVQQILVETGAVKWARQRADQLTKQAVLSLGDTSTAERTEATRVLKELAEFLGNRDH